MNKNNTAFANIIGQDAIKSRLKFAIQASESGRPLPHFLFVGPMGSGKTSFVRELAKQLKDSEGKRRSYFEVNCSTIKNLDQFMEQIVMPRIFDRDCTVLLDEAHCLPKNVVMFLLTVFNTEKSHIRVVPYGESEVTFDFCRQSIHLATTEPDKLFKPLKSRLETLALATYKPNELAEIVQHHVPDVEFEDNVIEEIVQSLRGTPRSAVQMARKIDDYCSIKGRHIFDSADFANLSSIADIKAHGLDSVEISILSLLQERGEMTLNEISATLSLSRTSLMNDHEHHLLKKGFMRVQGKRKITPKGVEVLKYVKK